MIPDVVILDKVIPDISILDVITHDIVILNKVIPDIINPNVFPDFIMQDIIVSFYLYAPF